MFERFTHDARLVVVSAQEEATRLHHGWIGTEHLLLALLGRNTPTAAVLARHGLTRDAGPALEWQGREFSRHTGVPAEVEVDGDLENLSEAQRTSIYRVVQEALTNCARHAKAKHVNVLLHAQNGRTTVEIKDDGVGFNPRTRSAGLGLLGIGERVEALDGKLAINSQPGKGTMIRIEIPSGVNV
jgi:signal transduction histidine kinase